MDIFWSLKMRKKRDVALFTDVIKRSCIWYCTDTEGALVCLLCTSLRSAAVQTHLWHVSLSSIFQTSIDYVTHSFESIRSAHNHSLPHFYTPVRQTDIAYHFTKSIQTKQHCTVEVYCLARGQISLYWAQTCKFDLNGTCEATFIGSVYIVNKSALQPKLN